MQGHGYVCGIGSCPACWTRLSGKLGENLTVNSLQEVFRFHSGIKRIIADRCLNAHNMPDSCFNQYECHVSTRNGPYSTRGIRDGLKVSAEFNCTTLTIFNNNFPILCACWTIFQMYGSKYSKQLLAASNLYRGNWIITAYLRIRFFLH